MKKHNIQGTGTSTANSRSRKSDLLKNGLNQLATMNKGLLKYFFLYVALSSPFIGPSTYAQENETLVCTAAKTGNPCLSPASSPQINIGAGNPIHLATGNKFQQETDLYMRASGLEIVRYYNSVHTLGGANGAGWRQSYSTRLYKIGQRWQILTDDGRRIMFKAPNNDAQNEADTTPNVSSTTSQAQRNTANNTQAVDNTDSTGIMESFSVLSKGAPVAYALDSNYGKLIWTQEGTWVWVTPEAVVRTFNTHGHLVHQLVPAYLPIYIQRLSESGPRAELITRVQGGEESLLYHYEDLDGQARLVRIDSPIGVYSYHYEKPGAHPYYRLDKVIRIDQWQRQYHYEPQRQAPDSPYLLTGISLHTPKQEVLRTNTWAYDEKGRANYSSVGFNGEDELHLEFVQEPNEPNSKGLTKVRDKAGNETQIHTTQIAGQYLVEKVTGYGCYLCPPVGTEASYDKYGRMMSINGHQISRDQTGHITRIIAPHPSWGPLTIDYDEQNRVIAWNSPATGTETVEYNNQGQVSRRKLANGTSYRYTYDKDGNIKEKRSKLKYQKSYRVSNGVPDPVYGYGISSPKSSYHLRKFNKDSPYFFYTARYRATHNTSYGQSYVVTPRSAYETHFLLPEFGEITRHYNKDRAVKSIDYKPLQEESIKLADFQENKIVFGNQLELSGHQFFPNMTLLLLKNKSEVLWHQLVMQDNQGHILSEAYDFPKQKHQEMTGYLYDERTRMVAAESKASKASEHRIDDYFYAWDKDGSSLAYQFAEQTTRPTIQRDPSGLPIKVGNKELKYNHHKRIQTIQKNGQVLVEYDYDSTGRRVSKNFNNKRILYYYLGDKLVGEWTTDKQGEIVKRASPSARHLNTNIHRRYIYAGDLAIAFIDYPIGSTESDGNPYSKPRPVHKNEHTLYYIHTNHIGQPIMITDEQQNIHWLARYSPTGKAEILLENIEFNLRAPGQYYDAETGWHDNYYRTYDPQAGHYLEPDPIGPLTINDPYGYAAQQPRRFIDPLGLLLFAFDGTTNSTKSNTNVLKLFKLYDGDKYYTEGTGALPDDSFREAWTGALFDSTGPKIFEKQKDVFLRYLDTAGPAHYDNTIPIDIVGFSRGAIVGMRFANFLKENTIDGHFQYKKLRNGSEHVWWPEMHYYSACLDFRFIGIFDTVAQHGFLGKDNGLLDYSASPSWGLISHAVALNEYRNLLPLVTYQDDDFVVEQGFLGNHSDLGGVHVPGNPTDRDNPHPDKLYGDLSHIPLAWMHTQAQTIGVPFKSLDQGETVEGSELHKVKNPVMHNTYGDFETVIFQDRYLQKPNTSDKHIIQNKDKDLGADQRKEHAAEANLVHYSRYRSMPLIGQVGIFGLIDATAYLEWLESTIGWTAPLEVVPFTPVH